MHAFQLDWVKNASVLKLENYRPRVSKKTQKNEIKELHCNKVPLTRNYVRNYPFKSNNQVYYNTVGQRNYTF